MSFPLSLLGLYARRPSLAGRHFATAFRLLANGGTAELRSRLRTLGGVAAQQERDRRLQEDVARKLSTVGENAKRNYRSLLSELLPFAQDLTVIDVIHDDLERLRLVHCHILRKYSLFDDRFYSDTYLKGGSGITPLDHYLKYGLPGGLRANPFFDPLFYAARYPEVIDYGFDPLVHYALFGWREGRECGPLFDAAYYLARNPDVAAAGLSPLHHFLSSGRAEGRSPTGAAGLSGGVARDRGTILIVSHDAELGGAQRVARVFAEWLLTSTKFEVKFVTAKGGPFLDHFRRIAETFDLEAEAKGATPEDVSRRLEAFAGPSVQAVFLNSAASGKFLSYWREKTPVLAFVHELPKLLASLESEFRLILDRADTIIAGSEAVATAIKDGYGFQPERLRTVHGFVDASPRDNSLGFDSKRAIKEALGLDPDAFLVAACGVLHWRKSPETFVDVAERVLKERVREVRFLWVGGGPDQEQCEKLVSEKGLEGKVVFTGYEPDIMRYLRAADLFLLTSQEDPFPLVCLDAATALAPIVCFEKAGGMPEFVGQGCGMSVPFMDAEAMADAVLAYMQDEDRLRAEGQAGRELVENEYTVASAGPKLLHHIREAAGLAPHVSVVVPNYNYEKFLPERLETIAAQTYQDFELILLDDRSRDGSVKILEDWVRRRPGTRLVVNDENSGSPFAQWLRGMELAQSDLIWIAEADDSCEPGLLSALIPALEDRNVFLAYVKSVPIGTEGQVYGDYEEIYLNRINHGRWSRPYVATDHEEAQAGLGIANCIPNASSLVFRRIDPEPNFAETLQSMRLCGDWYFYLRAMRGGKVAYCEQPLNLHRRHPETVTKSTEGSTRYFDEFAKVRDYVGRTYSIGDETREAIERFTTEDLDRFGVEDMAVRTRILEQAEMNGVRKELPTVLVVVSDLSPGGGQMFGIRLANAWTKRGGRAVLLNVRAFTDHPQVVSQIDDRVALLHADEMPETFAEMVRRYDVDVVHSSIWWADRYVQDHIADLRDLPWVVTMHGCYETHLDNPQIDLSFADRMPPLLERVDTWIPTARKNRRVFDVYGMPERELTIANGVAIKPSRLLSRRSLGLRDDAIVLCLATRAIPEKGWFAALEMVERLNLAGDKVDLMLIGEGPAADEIARKVPEHVHLYGQVANLQDYIAVADIGILPSFFVGESMPLVLLEMIAQSRPVIATDVGEIPAMLGTGSDSGGIIVPLKGGKVDVDGFVAAIRSLMDPKSRRGAGERAKARFDAEYTMDGMIEAYSDVYHAAQTRAGYEK
ncbi:glycosyltransferase [Aquibium oceanicum]|uniref:Glycosyltransferase n=1 Tax=Aquibium oceanicum TaxID=1670800 RepID=A0A1L3ST67_9HYPH|nr:glycosyltransferase [Aquibium oceanicum]APH72584.1 hypothetical protein BSQ44_15370 [Aquibium oceanicum]